jgi:LPXTG-site transpeptidase (sortase) family protein
MAKKRSNVFSIIGILIIFMGVSFFIYENNKNQDFKKINEDLIDNFFQEEIQENLTEELSEVEEVKKEAKPVNYNYMAVLEIPNINLKRGLVDITSKYNDVKYNLEILKGSNMPNILTSNLIIAGHNGNTNVSFFKSLDKLKTGDKIFLYYEGKKYEYSFEFSYEVNKNGSIEIIRDDSETAITLITCTKNVKDKQMVYVGYLSNSVAY